MPQGSAARIRGVLVRRRDLDPARSKTRSAALHRRTRRCPAALIEKGYVPTARRLIDEAREIPCGTQINFHTPIEWERRTLSPPAFGFQNAKRCPDGRLVFFDLEYPLG